MFPAKDLIQIDQLVSAHLRGRGLLDGALAPGQGIITCDNSSTPSLIHFQVGGFALFGGDPRHPAIPQLLNALPVTWIIPESAEWEQALLDPIAEKGVKRRNRTRFSPDKLKPDPPVAPPNGYQITPVTSAHVTDNRHPSGRQWAFHSIGAFEQVGIGYCALSEGSVASYAVSYAASDRSIEIEVQTHASHRRRGLGFCVCSHLIHHCLVRNITPHWDAANKISCGLAEKLGYEREEEYLSFRRLRKDESIHRAMGNTATI